MKTVADILERLVYGFDRVGQYMLPLLMVLIIVDVLGRRILSLPTVAFQEAQWHVHGALFLLCIAATWLKDGHVRVELVRDRLPLLWQRRLEVFGCCVFLLPYMLLLMVVGSDFTLAAFTSGEGSSAAEGLGNRWIIKAMLPVGFALMICAAVVILARRPLEKPLDSVEPRT